MKELNSETTICPEGEALTEVYRRFLPTINRTTLSIWYKVRDETVFVNRCIRKIEHAVRTYDSEKGSLDSAIFGAIRKSAAMLVKDSRVPWWRFVYQSEEGTNGGEDNPIDYIDDLAVVDDELMVKDRIASLAGDDSRRMFILKAWSEGLYNESELATLLAQRFGGNARSHCRFIQRFRIECQEKLRQIA